MAGKLGAIGNTANQAVSWDSSNSASKPLGIVGAIAAEVDDSFDYIKQ